MPALALVYLMSVNVQFVGGDHGPWVVQRSTVVRGESLERPLRIMIADAAATAPSASRWILRGVVSHQRYTTRAEARRLEDVQPPLGRSEATIGVLIPIRKSAEWWKLAQDERREIYEERSRHTSIGLEYLPQIARRLHHGRDLGEPFDFLTWFEFAPAHAHAFDELLGRMRASEEWQYVEREVEIRTSREDENRPRGA